ncbi:hypothetical protein D4R52_03180 [bacterium]|nr:MAG: hypothetical protein D4R52_03180 [bacterium]
MLREFYSYLNNLKFKYQYDAGYIPAKAGIYSGSPGSASRLPAPEGAADGGQAGRPEDNK